MSATSGLIHLRSKGTYSKYQVFEAVVTVKDADGKDVRVSAPAELVINHMALRRMIQKASDNVSKKSSDGPLTVKILPSILKERMDLP